MTCAPVSAEQLAPVLNLPEEKDNKHNQLTNTETVTTSETGKSGDYTTDYQRGSSVENEWCIYKQVSIAFTSGFVL